MKSESIRKCFYISYLYLGIVDTYISQLTSTRTSRDYNARERFEKKMEVESSLRKNRLQLTSESTDPVNSE